MSKASEWLAKRNYDRAEVEIGPCYYSSSGNAIWRKYAGELDGGGRYGACTCRCVPKRLIRSIHAIVGGDVWNPEDTASEVQF